MLILVCKAGTGKAKASFPTTENHLMKAQGKLSFFRKRERKEVASAWANFSGKIPVSR